MYLLELCLLGTLYEVCNAKLSLIFSMNYNTKVSQHCANLIIPNKLR